jgi:hypothetical protein
LKKRLEKVAWLSNQSERKSKRKVTYALFLIVAILAVLTVSFVLLRNENFYTMHGIKETKITTIHSSGGNQTYTYVYENKDWKATYDLGKKLILHEPLYTNSTDPGITNLMSVVCSTNGFTFTESSPSLPTGVLYASDASTATEKVDLVFQTPTTPYTGVFEYTMYYDYTLTQP